MQIQYFPYTGRVKFAGHRPKKFKAATHPHPA
jgi:hypothetical protein